FLLGDAGGFDPVVAAGVDRLQFELLGLHAGLPVLTRGHVDHEEAADDQREQQVQDDEDLADDVHDRSPSRASPGGTSAAVAWSAPLNYGPNGRAGLCPGSPALSR